MKLAAPVVALAVGATMVAAPAAAAPAKVRTLTGQVTAAPYLVKRKVVVPVLLDQRSAKRARLTAPVGVLLLKRAQRVKVRGQRARVAPEFLRPGDRLRSRARVTKQARRTGYWRLPARRFTVTKRAAALSPAELAVLLTGLGGDLGRLESALGGLTAYVQAGFAKLDTDLGGLRTNLGALATALADLEKRVEALESGMPALGTQVSELASQLAALQTALTALQGDVGGLEGDVGGLQGDIAALEASVTQLTTDIGTLQTNVGILCGPTSPLNALC